MDRLAHRWKGKTPLLNAGFATRRPAEKGPLSLDFVCGFGPGSPRIFRPNFRPKPFPNSCDTLENCAGVAELADAPDVTARNLLIHAAPDSQILLPESGRIGYSAV